MKITLPELSLVALVGVSGSGKSTFARRHFRPTEILSSDFFRGLVSDDENSMAATGDAFEALHFVLRKRLAAGRLTVIDATNVQREARQPLVTLAREYHTLPAAIVLHLPERLCQERNQSRPDRNFGPHVIRNQAGQLRRSLRSLRDEGFRIVQVLRSAVEIDAVEIERQPLWCDLRRDSGPFDIIGDIHGCFDELCALLAKLGYQIEGLQAKPPPGRKAVFLGDLVDRGPKVVDALRLVMNMARAGAALCVPGNHDWKLLRKLQGRQVQVTHGLAESVAQLEEAGTAFQTEVAAFLDGLISHYVLDGGRLVVAHAGMPESMQGRASSQVRAFALYGETTGEIDEFGLPVRYQWAANYHGHALVVYGHTPVAEPEWLNRTINIDTGCVFGGKLTALRYPEKELVSVPARATYYQPHKPLLPARDAAPPLAAQQQADELLDIAEVLGKRVIQTRWQRSITIRQENANAALEVMSRFAIHPKWLIYLPPTMSPSETSRLPGLLEHPAEAFAYYRHEGVAQVVCEEKHMGSRAVVVACRGEETARRRFGVIGEGIGACYTRTGRRFFNDPDQERQVLQRVAAAMSRAGLWEELGTDWVCLDCELMPWSAKAKELLRRQYAATGSAARSALGEAVEALERTASRDGDGVAGLLERCRQRAQMAAAFVAAYRHYCWNVGSAADLKLAPFHLLASEDAVHSGKDHAWHMETLARLCAADPELLLATPYRVVDTTSEESQRDASLWWEELTARGGEGMVVKPMAFVARGARGLAQPAVKCRGREYLRIIYGPEYTAPEHLERLRQRGLGAKRSLALREFTLGIEALERFVRREPLRQVHECVFGVLALESEPVDPCL